MVIWPKKLLPEAGALESARTYREKKDKPILAGIVKVLRSVYHAYLDLVSKFDRLQSPYAREIRKNNTLSDRIEDFASKNRELRNVVDNYERVCRAYGRSVWRLLWKRSNGRNRLKKSKNAWLDSGLTV